MKLLLVAFLHYMAINTNSLRSSKEFLAIFVIDLRHANKLWVNEMKMIIIPPFSFFFPLKLKTQNDAVLNVTVLSSIRFFQVIPKSFHTKLTLN